MAPLSQFLLLGLIQVQHSLVFSTDNGPVSQQEAMDFMRRYRPKEDGSSPQFFRASAELAVKTQSLPYASQVSKQMFMTYVLPYSHFDEPKDDWRPKMYETLLPYVKDKKTLQEAAEALFPAWGSAFGKQLHFKSNQTPQCMAPLTETLAKGYASCTGMSIFLADCMRAVGIPARIVGINEWNRPEKGNHNWVEIWMGDHWNFVDAVPDGQPVTWNHTWFNEQAKKQTSVPSEHAIMSPLWGPQANSVYAMTWRDTPASVPAIDVTANYAGGSQLAQASAGFAIFPIVVVLLSIVVLGGAGCVYKTSKDSSHYERIA